MNSILIGGRIVSKNVTLFNILSKISDIDNNEIKLNLNDYGYDILYETEKLHLFINGNELEEDTGNLIFDCEYKTELSIAELFLDKLIEGLTSNNIKQFEFDYSEVDDKGNVIGEEFEIKSGD